VTQKNGACKPSIRELHVDPWSCVGKGVLLDGEDSHGKPRRSGLETIVTARLGRSAKKCLERSLFFSSSGPYFASRNMFRRGIYFVEDALEPKVAFTSTASGESCG
jgi:hypothetical protein